MKENHNEIIGDAFEDMSISEMARVQGTEDVNPEASPVLITASEVVSSGISAASGTIAITKTAKGHC
ncbi:lichenicidin A2 family type 2 lantibiotic [Staphylococcus sp. HKU1]|jgi:type 2 lantibiotic (TIGR03893 family)|uniref:lichenicidin A2 family type 2 lantibiotic n=1 Tax=Staphylococcus sp. HKU1 TaxID=3068989 RepID=UPI003AADAA48